MLDLMGESRTVLWLLAFGLINQYVTLATI